MRLGEQDVLTEDMVIGPATDEPLHIVISTDGGVITGNVIDGDGNAVDQALVLLAPDGCYSSVLSFFKGASLDEHGEFEIIGVTPGTYRLFAFSEMESGAWREPEFLAPFQDLGTPLEIREGERIVSEVTLIPAAEPEAAR